MILVFSRVIRQPTIPWNQTTITGVEVLARTSVRGGTRVHLDLRVLEDLRGNQGNLEQKDSKGTPVHQDMYLLCR